MFTLEEIKDKLRWQAAGVGQKDAEGRVSGETGFDYTSILVDEEYAQKLYEGFDYVVCHGHGEYQKV